MLPQENLPIHHQDVNWLEHETLKALQSCHNLAAKFICLKKNQKPEHIHETRIALRRWSVVWEVLELDGFASKEYKRKIGARLQKLYNLLGKVRDLDTLLKLGKKMSLNNSVIRLWKKQREQQKKKFRSYMHNHNLSELTIKLEKYIQERSSKIAKALGSATKQPVHQHLEIYIKAQEYKVMRLETRANSQAALHQLRLAIKKWRYLLSEFFDLSNLHLVKAQQNLGEIHDVDRMITILNSQKQNYAKAKIKNYRQGLARQFKAIRKELPYGLRP